MAKAPTVKAVCIQCGTSTRHVILHKQSQSSSSGYPEGVQFWKEYQIIQCMGCEIISFREEEGSTEWWDPVTGRPEVYETLYPSRTKGRLPMERHDMLPGKAKRLYLEILKALNHGAALLAALGIRALIEAICIDFECTGRNLESRIETLVSKGHLAQKHAKFLHALRFMGNEAAHEINTPSPTELTSALDIVESLMQTIYTLDELASHLKSKQAKS